MQPINDFSGGLWIPADPVIERQPGFAIPRNALLEADNVEYLISGGIKGRRGHVLYDPAAVEGPVIGLHKHYPRPAHRVGGFSICVGENDASLGGTAWIGPEQTEVADTVSAQCLLTDAGDISQGLVCRNPYASAPHVPDVAISGIIVEIQRRSVPNGGVFDEKVQLIIGGARVGANRAITDFGWNPFFQSVLYGGAGDLWGLESITAAQLNAMDFGVWLSCKSTLTLQQAEVDFIRVYAYLAEDLDPTFIIAVMEPAGRTSYKKQTSHGGYGQIYRPPAQHPGRPRFVGWSALDRTYIFDGTNRAVFFDGYSFYDAGEQVPVGPYATFWKERLISTRPEELGFGVYACGIGDPTNWDPRFSLNVGDDHGGKLTGLEGFGDELIMLKDGGCWSFQGEIESQGRLYQYSDIGCWAPNSVAVTPAGIIFVGRDGVYITSGAGSGVTELSTPLRALFDSRLEFSTYPDAIGVYAPRKQQYWLKLSPSALDGYVLQRIARPDGDVYSWSHMPVMPMNIGYAWPGGADTGELFLGGADGLVREYDRSSTDNEAAIAVSLRTASMRLSSADNIGRVTHVQAFTRATQPMTLSVRYDDANDLTVTLDPLGQTLPDPDFQHLRKSFTDQSVLGRTVSVAIVNPSDGPAFELHELAIATRLRTSRAWR